MVVLTEVTMNKKKKKSIVTVLMWVATFLVLLLGGFTFTPSESPTKQIIGVALIAVAATATVFIWLQKPPAGSGDDGPKS